MPSSDPTLRRVPSLPIRPGDIPKPFAERPGGDTQHAVEALERLSRLNEELRTRPLHETPPICPDRVEAPLARLRKILPFGKGIKTLLAVAIAVALGWIPLQRLLATTSAEATVNARLINLRAPIDGKVSILAPTLAVGNSVKPGESLLRLTNVRADRGRLNELRRTVSGLHSESAALTRRLDQLKRLEADLRAQRNAFQEGRIRQLESRAAELAVQITSAEAQQADAEEGLLRSQRLHATGAETMAIMLHVERDSKVSKLSVEAARIHLQGNKVELDAARKGLYVGDSYNDLPRSAQRLDEVGQQIIESTSQLDERNSRLAYLEKELAAETDLFATYSNAEVTATVRGRIWEVLTANGEEVRTGQDLLRVLDCGGAVVTATVSEAVYNNLWVGQPARFHLRGESQEYSGTVGGLTGLAAAGSNFAIKQIALTREPYHVTIAVPGLAAREVCNVGRTGQVTFDRSAASSASTTASSAKAADVAPGQSLNR
jgi:multidrug resistance efflux pump